MTVNTVKFVSRYVAGSQIQSEVIVNKRRITFKVQALESELTLFMAEELARALRVPMESDRLGVKKVTPYVEPEPDKPGARF